MKLCIVLPTLSMVDVGIIAVQDAWRAREIHILQRCNEEFRRLGLEEQKVMVAAIRDDDHRQRPNVQRGGQL